mmetsp:Transcript_104530/g.181518  ORF Transcript_104530/g.181518 Transcript_104530/m.181518 type:complete len:200 (-) Transcript_104530:207-806(-)
MVAEEQFEHDACFAATCSSCGETYVVAFDPEAIDFKCSHITAACDDLPVEKCISKLDDDGSSLEDLTPSERKTILEDYDWQPGRVPKPSSKKKSAAVPSNVGKIRYLNGEVVSHKGERFLVEDPWACLRPNADSFGTCIGGVIGSHRLGRRGLGFKKRPQAEVSKIQLSRMARIRTKKPEGCTFSGRGPHLVHSGFKVA